MGKSSVLRLDAGVNDETQIQLAESNSETNTRADRSAKQKLIDQTPSIDFFLKIYHCFFQEELSYHGKYSCQ